MIQMPDNGTRRELYGVTRIFYEGYWVRCYAPPAENLEEKKKLIMRLTRRAFHHTEEGINTPGRRCSPVRCSTARPTSSPPSWTSSGMASPSVPTTS
jgi:hypothetical protein